MSAPVPFIHDDQIFSAVRKGVSSAVDLERALPDRPFRKSFESYSFEEFDWALSAEFWSSAKALARTSGDQAIIMAVLDPDPVRYFKAAFGFYNWAKLSVDLDKDDYWAFLNQAPAKSPADSVLGNSERIVWLPPSEQWVIWGERSSGLCVLASNQGHQSVPWKSLAWAQSMCPEGETSSFAQKLQLNFVPSIV